MVLSSRKPFQKQERRRNAEFVVTQIWENLDLEKVEETGSLFPRGNLKKAYLRRLLQFVADHACSGKRYFTGRLLRLVVRKLIRKLPFSLATDPRQSQEDYVSIQVKRLSRLTRQAKKIALRVTQRKQIVLELTCCEELLSPSPICFKLARSSGSNLRLCAAIPKWPTRTLQLC